MECDGDPGPLVVDEAPEPEAPPEGCLSANDHERVLTAMGRDAEAFARKLCTGKGRINYATAAKLFEVAIRAYRAAAEYTQTRERRNHVRWLEKRRRAIGGKRGRN